jgi:hypothetical protein
MGGCEVMSKEAINIFPSELEYLLTPQQRTAAEGEDTRRAWVGLTDEEHTNIQKQADYNQFMSASEFAVCCQVLVEAKLKEKNT